MSSRTKTILFVLVAGVAVFGTAQFATGFLRQSGEQQVRLHTVSRETLELSLVERGRLESQSNVVVKSEMEDIRGDGILGNAIIWLVENGTNVKKGDLLAVLDSGTHIERVDEQILETDQARARQLEADVLYKNRISQNETLEATADLALDLAKLELEMFEDPEKGTYRLQLDEINRTIDETENLILAAQASLQLSGNERDGLETLFRYGYVGKNELDQVRLKYLQAQSNVAANSNKLQTQLATVRKMNVFEREMQLLTLQGAVKTAERTVQQVQLDNQATLSKAKSKLDNANRILEKEEERLSRYRWHLEQAEIRAPQDGMVAYATPRHYREQKIELGATIWEGQRVLYLPDLRRMQVETVVHETARTWVRSGLKATVRIEAMPEKEYLGTVQKVELMPDRRKMDESNTKVYKTLVTIDEEVEGLRPGMTALVEIHLDKINDTATIPLEAIHYEGDGIFCHVRRGGLKERVSIKLGRSNDEMAEVTDGVEPGDQVVLP